MEFYSYIYRKDDNRVCGVRMKKDVAFQRLNLQMHLEPDERLTG